MEKDKITYSFGNCKFCGLDKVLKDGACVSCTIKYPNVGEDFLDIFKTIINKEEG